MTLGRTIKRACAIAAVTAATLAVGGATASAHIIEIDPPGNSDKKMRMAGGAPLPAAAQGEGLVPAGPGGMFGLQSPAHYGGLNTACEALRANENGVVDIYGPPTAGGCPHGT